MFNIITNFNRKPGLFLLHSQGCYSYKQSFSNTSATGGFFKFTEEKDKQYEKKTYYGLNRGKVCVQVSILSCTSLQAQLQQIQFKNKLPAGRRHIGAPQILSEYWRCEELKIPPLLTSSVYLTANPNPQKIYCLKRLNS